MDSIHLMVTRVMVTRVIRVVYIMCFVYRIFKCYLILVISIL